MRRPAVSPPSAVGPVAAAALLGVALLACAGAYTPPPATSSPAPQTAAASDTMHATVQQVNPPAGWVDCLYGTGLALRVTRVHVVSDTRVVVNDATASIAALRPGDIVLVAFRVTAEGEVATEIRKVGRMGTRGGGR